MPSILRIGPYRFFFYSNEGRERPHVHVRQERKLAKFWLDPVSLASSHGFKGRAVRRLERLVTGNRRLLLEAWNEFFSPEC